MPKDETPPLKILCPWCSKPWTEHMMDVDAHAAAGCETCGYGSEPHGTVTITCEYCKKIVYQKEF